MLLLITVIVIVGPEAAEQLSTRLRIARRTLEACRASAEVRPRADQMA